MARKPSLSPSKITTYLACAMKYRWTYVDDRGRWYIRAKKYFSFGTTLHHVLQRFHDDGDHGVQTTDEALAALEESWIDAGYSSAQEMQEALSEGRSIVETYVRRQIESPRQARVLMTEKQLRADLGPFVLIGRVDRVDEHEDGRLEIVDYKSGRLGVSADDVKFDLAMSCYQLLLREKFPDRPISATIHALRADASATAALSDEELAEFRRDLVVLGEQILSRDFEDLRPVTKAICPHCDFLALCRQHPAWDDAALQGLGSEARE